METTDHATEGDPLKRGEDGTVTAPATTEPKKKSCNEMLGLSKLSHWRTAAFFLSLFLCLTIAFAFSFIIPCPVRPQYLITWNRTFPQAATYDFLAFEDANSDKVMDVLFVLKNEDGAHNKSCALYGLPSPCVFLVAVDGTDGDTLWEKALQPEFHWAKCGLDIATERYCLLSLSHNITAIRKSNGSIIWEYPQPTGLQASLPVLSVPDLEGDKVKDLVLVASDSTQTQLVLLSGNTGTQIGSTVILDFTNTASHLLHRIENGSYYILLQKDTGVYGLAMSTVAKVNAGTDADLKDKKGKANTVFVPIFESETVSMLRTKEADESSDLLILTQKGVASVNGKNLQVQWRFNTSSVPSNPSFGHFNKDAVLDVVVEEDLGNNTKRILILDGKSGVLLWEVSLLATANSPRAASLHTTKSSSVFMFWGLMPSESNSSESFVDRRSYMLLPRLSQVLLEYSNFQDHIITFKATLMERGRHAAYLLLMGPEKGAEGTVILNKRKLKQDVPLSKVRPIGTGGASYTTDKIIEAFNRLRFSDE